MTVARVTDIISSSTESFEDAVRPGVKRASKTLKNVRGAWVEGQKVVAVGKMDSTSLWDDLTAEMRRAGP